MTDTIARFLRQRITVHPDSVTDLLALVELLWEQRDYITAIPNLERLILAMEPVGKNMELIVQTRLRLSIAVEASLALSEVSFAPGAPDLTEILLPKEMRELRRSLDILEEACRKWPTYLVGGRGALKRLHRRQVALGLPKQPDDVPSA